MSASAMQGCHKQTVNSVSQPYHRMVL